MPYHLAQINVSRALAPLESPVMADFVAALDRINAVAESSDGFLWRLQADDGNALAIRADDDPLVVVNMSVWRDVESLHAYTFRSDHAAQLKQRRRWFEPPDGPMVALFWWPAGEPPSLTEGLARLAHLKAHGPTAKAFDFKHPYAPPEDAR